jgi:hypothetical protein
MALSDPIADMLTRIRNAVRKGAREVTIPNSKICSGIAQVLKDEGYIGEFDVIEDGKQGLLRVNLKYGPRGERSSTASIGFPSRAGGSIVGRRICPARWRVSASRWSPPPPASSRTVRPGRSGSAASCSASWNNPPSQGTEP